MKAVIMAGGEGTRLRPLTLDKPKPMTPLFDKPILEHIIRLLRENGITELCITLHYMADTVREYFGDGSRFGVRLRYFVEEEPLGTAGSVKACLGFLGTEDFLIISGDAVCDLDLRTAIAFHQEKRAEATLLLYRHPHPLEYGLVLTNSDGRITNFLEKPSWGQVLSNTVNTGIYLLSPSVLRELPVGEARDFGRDVFPALLAQGGAMYGFVPSGYWCDMGDCRAYLDCMADALSGRVALDLGVPQRAPGVWSAEPVPADVTIVPPCRIGKNATIGPGCVLGPHTDLELGSQVGRHSLVQRSIVLGAQIGDNATLYGAVLASGSRLENDVVLDDGVVLGTGSVVEQGAHLREDVRLWPGLRVPADTRLDYSLTSAGPRTSICFCSSGALHGVIGEDLTSELMLTLGSVLGQEGRVGLGHAGGQGAALLARAASCGISSAGKQVLAHDLSFPAGGAWLARYYALPASLFIQQEGDEAYLYFFGPDGLPLGRNQERKLENALRRRENVRVPVGRIGGYEPLTGCLSGYTGDAVSRAGTDQSPSQSLTVMVPKGTPSDNALAAALEKLGCTVLRQEKEGVPVFFTRRGGFHLLARTEKGVLLPPERILTLSAMIELENGNGKVAVPPQAPTAIDLAAINFGGKVLRLDRDGDEAAVLYAELPWLWDAVFAACRICGRLSSTGERLWELDGKAPRFSTCRQEVPLTTGRGEVMQAIAGAEVSAQNTGAGLRVRAGSGWVYVSPLARRNALRVVAECRDAELATELCELYAKKVSWLDRRENTTK